MRLIAIAAVCLSCSEPAAPAPTPEPEPTVVAEPTPPPDAEPPAPDVDEPVTVPAAIAVSEVVRIPVYEQDRYRRRCRTESRRAAPSAERVEDRDEARQQARLMARDRAIDPVVMFARIAYGETGPPQLGENDHPSTQLWDEAEAFLAVIDQRRGRMSRLEMMAVYSPRRVFPRPDDRRQQWLAEVQRDGRTPPSWPTSGPPWRTYGCPRWLATVDAAKAVLEARDESVGKGPCDEVPDHWGGSFDTFPFEHGWRRVVCAGGHTRNLFWAVPSRS